MRNLMSPEKRKLLVKLQKLENQWSSDLILNGRVTVEMHKTETDIKSTRNTIKYQDIQENLALARA
jgi:hypothetical protein